MVVPQERNRRRVLVGSATVRITATEARARPSAQATAGLGGRAIAGAPERLGVMGPRLSRREQADPRCAVDRDTRTSHRERTAGRRARRNW
jgi:hypothetical protein